ncbi:hypothetical protein SAMN04488063_3525 [Halopelagius inordinatus]|uniref:Uncharacterized protein n=1 Tax=Halopelagius inordinatus TaxID=553467 RepID=A0A1I2WEK8_9EURY|nr:hypothetical protein [Halopelagius inordinatus]SFG99743.1 hypothetical protein SAMN04488063_3525 [Halopelagius inordinatus]
MPARRPFAAGVVGTLFGGIVPYLLFPDALLAATSAAVWGLGAGLTVTEGAAWVGDPGTGGFEDALPGVVLLLVGLFGFHDGLPVADSLRIALVFLAAGALSVCTNAGVRFGRRMASE